MVKPDKRLLRGDHSGVLICRRHDAASDRCAEILPLFTGSLAIAVEKATSAFWCHPQVLSRVPTDELPAKRRSFHHVQAPEAIGQGAKLREVVTPGKYTCRSTAKTSQVRLQQVRFLTRSEVNPVIRPSAEGRESTFDWLVKSVKPFQEVLVAARDARYGIELHDGVDRLVFTPRFGSKAW